MGKKRVLSAADVEEIRRLRGRLPEKETRRRFGIGTSRLYDIWNGKEEDGANQQSDVVSASGTPETGVSAGPAALLSVGLPASEARENPTIVDFYDHLGRLEIGQKETMRLLVELLGKSEEEDADDELASLQEEVEETAEEVSETRTDIQKIVQMAETAKNWVYISFAALVVWKVLAKTWKQCVPAAGVQTEAPGVHNDSQFVHPARDRTPDLASRRYVDPHHMA